MESVVFAGLRCRYNPKRPAYEKRGNQVLADSTENQEYVS